MTTGFAELDVILEEDRLHDALGRDGVRVTRMRHKPGQYAVGALADAAGPAGWVRVTGDLGRAKRDVERAQRVDRPVTLRAATDRLFVSSGDLWSDPKLADLLARHADVVDASVVVRHNPLRRLVLRRGTSQIRVTVAEQPAVEAWAPALLEEGAGLTAALRSRSGAHLTRWEWLPGESLDALLGHDPSTDRSLAEELGRLLAQVHATPYRGADVGPRLPAVDPVALCAAADDLALLDSGLGGRMRALVAALPPLSSSPEVLLHGDFSADQVIRTATDLRVIDLDRAGVGPAVRDLASALAVETIRAGEPWGPASEALLDGYETGGGRRPSEPDLAAALAAALLSRAQEPLRQARADWRAATDAILTTAGRLIR